MFGILMGKYPEDYIYLKETQGCFSYQMVGSSAIKIILKVTLLSEKDSGRQEIKWFRL